MAYDPTYTLTDGTTVTNNNLAQNAYLIGEAIKAKSLNTDKWDAMIPKSVLPTGVGENLTSLVYDASLPTTSANGSTVGANWTRVADSFLSANALNSATDEQVIAGAGVGTIGTATPYSYVKFTKVLKDYQLNETLLKTPWFHLNDFRTAANVAKQWAAITNAMTKVVKWTWSRWAQESYEKICGNLVCCKTSSTPIRDTVDIKTTYVDPVTGSAATSGTANNPFYRLPLTALDFNTSGSGDTDILPNAYISNKILDRLWNRLQILTPPEEAYGMDNGAPVFCLVLSTDASYALKTESGNRDDVRKSSMVDQLIKPLGIDSSFRGFYHMVQPDMPRFNESGGDGTSGILTRVEPLTSTGAYNTDYDTATYEAAYVVHKSVMEAQVPGPVNAPAGVSFNPQNYKGEWNWCNIRDAIINPLGDKGFFLGQLACANKPVQHEYGYVILFKRTVTTPAA